MSPHPLIERARDREVRGSAGFHEAAAKLDGAALRQDWDQEVAAAPRRRDAGKRYLSSRKQPPARLGGAGRDQEPLALAFWRHAREAERALVLPDGTAIQLVGARVPLRSAAVDPLRADDPNRGVGEIDLLGVTGTGRLAVVQLAYAAPDAARAGTGETPLRALLEALACCATAWANRAALAEEVAAVASRELSEESPVLVLLGTPRYWELCRRRAAQKGAAWIQQMERLAGQLEESLGVSVHYLALAAPRDGACPPDAEGWPAFAEPPRLAPAWEESAGRVRPKPKPRPKARVPAVDAVVAADPSRPVRGYAMSESYQPGDRIAHPLLGEGVVQGPVGPGKIKVHFEGQPRVLVHERHAPRA